MNWSIFIKSLISMVLLLASLIFIGVISQAISIVLGVNIMIPVGIMFLGVLVAVLIGFMVEE